ASVSTWMSAGLPNRVLSLLPPVGPSLPMTSTGLPSLVYLKMALSVSALPAIQTNPLRSTWMPCSLATHGLVSGPPQPWMKLPSASNSMTDGAGAQHLLRGGLSVAPFSSSVSVRGRCSTQTWSLASTATLAIWPNSQLLGSGLGQNGSTWNFGGSAAEEDDENATTPKRAAMAAHARRLIASSVPCPFTPSPLPAGACRLATCSGCPVRGSWPDPSRCPCPAPWPSIR